MSNFKSLDLAHKKLLASQVGMLENAVAILAVFYLCTPDEMMRMLWDIQQKHPYYADGQEIEEIMRLWDVVVKQKP
ncbi:hypothetical protein ACL6C3_16780 [Capilliphycus salinus ALCB114379]|uniref:hypothetical protein n=1 Tax=Capilliphycus salinus TaxID=2768948 RepID=UPI0039A4EE0C